MKQEEIDKIFEETNSEVLTAHTEIVAMQKGQGTIVRTGQSHLDYFLVGGLQNKMVFIGSRPSQGKTYHCETLINSLFDTEINPHNNISLLRLNLEMQTKSLLLRDLKRTLGKKMIDIVSVPYTEEEKVKVTQVVNKHRNPRVTNFSRALVGEELKYLLKKFIENSESKFGKDVQKVVLVDHLHIYQTKKDIDEVLTIFNEFKLEDSNLSFVVYFQLNRTLEEVWRDSKEKKANPKNFLPHSGFIYNSDSLYQIGDLVLCMVIPQVIDLEEFAVVYKDRHEHLKEHFVQGSDDNVTVRLKGRNRIYYNYIKIRLIDDFEDPRLYCDLLNPQLEDKTTEKKSSTTAPDFSIPIVDFSSAMDRARGSEFEGDKPPF